MSQHTPFVRRCASFFFWTGGLLCARLFKFSFMIGSHIAFFSGASCLVPAAALAGQAFPLVGLVRLLSVWSNWGTMRWLPGLCAGLALRAPSRLTHLLIPLACMVLFVAHPIAGQAWFYALFWLVPMIVHGLKPQSLFARALGATFVAHAVGSVVWAYTVPMSPHQWMALVPVVPVERMLMAAGIVAVHTAHAWFVTAAERCWHAIRQSKLVGMQTTE